MLHKMLGCCNDVKHQISLEDSNIPKERLSEPGKADWRLTTEEKTENLRRNDSSTVVFQKKFEGKIPGMASISFDGKT